MRRTLFEDWVSYLIHCVFTRGANIANVWLWFPFFFLLLDGRTICGRRARVELSNGKGGGGGSGGGRYRGPPPRSRGRPFHPDDRCYECGDRGHYARDCNRYRRGGGGRRRYEFLLINYLICVIVNCKFLPVFRYSNLLLGLNLQF